MARQHVIPHNIMDVDFKLFGFMNLKQFIYVAIGAAMAYVTYIMTRDKVIPGIFGWPIIIFSIVAGLSFGLLPFKGRALDQWLISFILAVRSPTKRAWMKKGITPSVIPTSIAVDLLKPQQIKMDTETTVGQIIGGLNIPNPELEGIEVTKKVEAQGTISSVAQKDLVNTESVSKPTAQDNKIGSSDELAIIAPHLSEVAGSSDQTTGTYEKGRFDVMGGNKQVDK